MTDRKFTDEEVIKALEHYKGFRLYPFDKHEKGDDKILVDDALDLINRQKAEIERLRYEAKIDESEIKCTRIHRDMARAEAIKEFAEKAKRRLPIVSPSVFDQIVKEMKEEQK